MLAGQKASQTRVVDAKSGSAKYATSPHPSIVSSDLLAMPFNCIPRNQGKQCQNEEKRSRMPKKRN